MKIFLLLLTIIYLLPEIYSFKLLIKPKKEYYKFQQKNIDRLKKRIDDDYDEKMDTVANVLLLLFLCYYAFYMGTVSIVMGRPWVTLISGLILILFMIDYYKSKGTVFNPEKLQERLQDSYLFYERIKIIFTFGYGLLVLVLLIMR